MLLPTSQDVPLSVSSVRDEVGLGLAGSQGSVLGPRSAQASDLPSSRASCRGWFVLLLVLGVAPRLVRYLLQFPIWGDEAFICLNLLDRDFADLAGRLRFDQVAPLLFLWAEKLVHELLGGSELALRLLPLMAGIGSLFLFVKLSSTVLGPRAALLAAGILAVSYYPIRHACEIKPYAFDLFASLALLTPAASWLRQPRPCYLLLLLCLTPPALGLSYPATFTAGAVSLALLPAVLRRRDRPTSLLFVLFNVLAGCTFFWILHLVGEKQHGSMVGSSSGYWDACFPPDNLLALPGWLLSAHTGNMMAYPLGGRNGGSLLTFLLCLTGTAALWKARGSRDSSRRLLLVLLLSPLALTLTAAWLGRYPYGGSARVAQHLAPSICLLAGAGLASLIEAASASGATRQRSTRVVLLLLVAIGVVGVVRDFRKPWKTEADQRARQVVRSVLADAGKEGPVVVVGAPARLYPSIEWYLRQEAGQVAWVNSPGEVCLGPETEQLRSLHFRTNATARDCLVPSFPNFVLAGRKEYLLQMGPEPDATHSCQLLCWRRKGPERKARAERIRPAGVRFHRQAFSPCTKQWRMGLRSSRLSGVANRWFTV